MGTKVTFLTQPRFTLSFFKDGKSNEGDESHGCHEGNEGHEEEAHLCQACQASCVLWQDWQDRNWIEEDRPCQVQVWQDRQQEEEPPWQAAPWIAAVQKARKELKIKGFAVVKKGTPLYKKAKELYAQ